MDSCLSNSYTDVTCDQQFSGDVQSKNTFSGFLSFGGMQWGQRSLQKAANVVLHTFKFSFSQARTYLWSCSCGAMHCLFKADNPNREREGESEGEGEGEVAGRVLGQSEEEREVRANKRQWVQTHSVCDTLWWRVRGWQRWRERGALPDRERERQREREGEIKERDRGGETRMRDSSSAARASALPACATCVYSTLPESRLSSLCVSHGSDLGEWSGTEQRWRATDLCVCLHCGQVSSLCISLCFILLSAFTSLSSVRKKWTTSTEFLPCSVLLLLSLHAPPPIGSIL